MLSLPYQSGVIKKILNCLFVSLWQNIRIHRKSKCRIIYKNTLFKYNKTNTVKYLEMEKLHDGSEEYKR